MSRARTWTCRRVTAGVPCGRVNGSRKRKCGRCGKPRSARKRPAHMAALDLPYELYIELNGGEHCGICFRTDSGPAGKKFHRDHDHRTGAPRGLLCFPCNAALRPYMTGDWLRDAAVYVERVIELSPDPRPEVEFPTLDEARAEHARAIIERQDDM